MIDESGREGASERLGRLYGALRRIHHAIVGRTPRDALLDETCHALVEGAGYRGVSIGAAATAGDASGSPAATVPVDGHETLQVYADDALGDVEHALLAGAGADLALALGRLDLDGSHPAEARYQRLFDYAPDGILIADARGTYLDANPSVCRMLGYARDELIGKHGYEIVVADEAARIDPALDAILSSSNYHAEWRFRRRDGTVFPADVLVKVMPDGNLLALLRDVSARKQAEQALRQSEALLRIAGHAARLGGWTIELPDRITWSDELCAIHEVPPGFRPTPEQATAFYVPEHRSQMVDAVTACIRDCAPFDLQLQVTTATAAASGSGPSVTPCAARTARSRWSRARSRTSTISASSRSSSDRRRRWTRSVDSPAGSPTTSTTCSR